MEARSSEIESMFLSWCSNNKHTIIDNAVQAFDVASLITILAILELDDETRSQILNKAYTKMFQNHTFTELTVSQYQMIEHLLKLGVAVNAGESVFPVTEATKANSYSLVALLCRYGADCNKTDAFSGWDLPPVSIAAEKGYYDILELLLQHGATIVNCSYESAIDQALINDHLECASLLSRHGAKVNICRVIDVVMERQNFKVFDFLIEYFRADSYEYIIKHKDDVFLSAVIHTTAEFVTRIFNIGYGLVGESPSWSYFLRHARNGDIARYLIKKGADVNTMTETESGNFSLLYLILSRSDMKSSDQEEVVQALLENGASPDISGDISPLMLAALNSDNTGILKLLTEYGADVNARDKEGDNVFSYCMKRGDSSNAVYLMRYAQSKDFLDMHNMEGVTPLMLAVRFGDVNIVRELLVYISSLNNVDGCGNTALLHAIDSLHDPDYDHQVPIIVKTLIEAGCDINLQNDNGMSPLMMATNRFNPSIMNMLLKADARVNETNKVDKSKTALSYFCPPSDIERNEFKKCLSYFIDQDACLTYLQPITFHRILLLGDTDLIYKLFINGLGPVCISADNYLSFVFRHDPRFQASPLCTALLDGNVGLARSIIDSLFLTPYDIYTLPYNRTMRCYLKSNSFKQCLNLVHELSEKPLSLFKIAFVAVSTVIGTGPGRSTRVNKLEIPGVVKDELLFKAPIVSRLTQDTSVFRYEPIIPDRVEYIFLLTSCNHCKLWRKLTDERTMLGYNLLNGWGCSIHEAKFPGHW